MNTSYNIVLRDGRELDESQPWSSVSELVQVGYFGEKKSVYLCTEDVMLIQAVHDGLHHSLSVPEGFRCYQAVRAESGFHSDGSSQKRVVGRVVGLVKDGEVIEEYFLDGLANTVHGRK